MTDAIDISMEAQRVYHYANGDAFMVPEPVRLHLLSDDRGVSHRVETANGDTYRPERGWVGISWTPKSGAPPFVA